MNTKVTFYQRSFNESLQLIEARLTGVGYQIVEIFSSSAVFGDGYVHIPPAKEIAEFLKVSLSCVYENLKKIREKLPFFQIIHARSLMLVKRDDGKNRKSKNFLPSTNLENLPIIRNHFQEFVNDSIKLETQQLELLTDKDSDFAQTINKDYTSQTGEEVDEKINKESSEEIIQESEKKDIEYSVLPNHLEKEKVSPSVTQNKYGIPQDLLERLRMFEVKTSEAVLIKISEHHISQAYGAIAHVENTFETIRDKTAVFLYQLPKQPVERMGQRHDEQLLEKQKQEVERIAREKENPSYFEQAANAFQTIKESLAKKQKPTLKSSQ